ncbi:MAG: hypothetical protein WC205_02600 [Opitutaceae bacterium]
MPALGWQEGHAATAGNIQHGWTSTFGLVSLALIVLEATPAAEVQKVLVKVARAAVGNTSPRFKTTSSKPPATRSANNRARPARP